jgi:hypothetical protein
MEKSDGGVRGFKSAAFGLHVAWWEIGLIGEARLS